MATIKRNPVNQFNFLRWYEAIDTTLPVTGCPDLEALPGTTACKTAQECNPDIYKLPVVEADELRFMINTPLDVNYQDVEDLQLTILQPVDALLTATLSGYLATAGIYLHGTITIPCLPDGTYNFVLSKISDNQVLLVSAPVEVINKQNWSCTTSVIRYKNSSAYVGYPYASLPAFYNQFRVHILIDKPQYETEESLYRDTNYNYRRNLSTIDKILELQTEYLDKETHEALLTALKHTEFYANDTLYLQKGSYEIEHYDNYGLAPAATKVIDVTFSKINKIC